MGGTGCRRQYRECRGDFAGATVIGVLALVIQWREEKAMERLYGDDFDKAKEEKLSIRRLEKVEK